MGDTAEDRRLDAALRVVMAKPIRQVASKDIMELWLAHMAKGRVASNPGSTTR